MTLLGAYKGVIDHEASIYQTIENHFLKVIQVWSGGFGQHISLALMLLEERVLKGDFNTQRKVVRLIWLVLTHLFNELLFPLACLAGCHFSYKHLPCFVLKNTQSTLLSRGRLYVYYDILHVISRY